MRYWLTLLRLRLKAGVRSAFFWGMLALFAGMAFAFCALLPERPQINVQVGLLAEAEAPAGVAQTLLQNEDYRFVLFESETALKQSVLTGETHCAYKLGGGECPVTLYAAKGSYMTPVLNETVLAAYLQADTPKLMAEFLAGEGLPVPPDSDAYFAQVRERSKPMTIELSTAEGFRFAENDGGMQALLYAILGALFPAAAVLRVLLRGREGGAVQYPAGCAGASALAQLCADALLGAVALLAADAVIAAMVPAPVYPLSARLVAIGALAVLVSMCSALALPLAKRPSVPLLALPAVLVFWVLLSGAVLDPSFLPNGMGALRWLSPPWYFLRLLAIL